MRRVPRALLLAWLGGLLLACGEPGLPDDKRAYEGRWRGPGTLLEIRGDGRVVYTRVRAHVHRQVMGPIRWFDGDDFVVGWPWWGTRFRVERPPHLENGRWKMIVNEIELLRISTLDDLIEV